MIIATCEQCGFTTTYSEWKPEPIPLHRCGEGEIYRIPVKFRGSVKLERKSFSTSIDLSHLSDEDYARLLAAHKKVIEIGKKHQKLMDARIAKILLASIEADASKGD